MVGPDKLTIVAGVIAIVILYNTLNLTANGRPVAQYTTELVGEAEIPPLFSESYGNAALIGNESKLWYQVNVSSLDKITGIFLYKGDSLTDNGQMLVALLNLTKPTERINGILAQGS